MKLFLSPHNDDETLFGAFTIMRESPMVVVVYDGYVQRNRGATKFSNFERRHETNFALAQLGHPGAKFLGMRDDAASMPEDVVFRLRAVIDVDQKFETVYAPLYDLDGHEQHNIVALAASCLDADKIIRYSTYTRSGGRQVTANEVTPTDGGMIARKHRALACYMSQLDMDPRLGCWPWFMGDLKEYIA